jgi:hypothetical protein
VNKQAEPDNRLYPEKGMQAVFYVILCLRGRGEELDFGRGKDWTPDCFNIAISWVRLKHTYVINGMVYRYRSDKKHWTVLSEKDEIVQAVQA